MPTLRNMAKYDELRQSMCAVLELKKLLDRAELELKTSQNRIAELEAMDPDTRKASAMAGLLSDVSIKCHLSPLNYAEEVFAAPSRLDEIRAKETLMLYKIHFIFSVVQRFYM